MSAGCALLSKAESSFRIRYFRPNRRYPRPCLSGISGSTPHRSRADRWTQPNVETSSVEVQGGSHDSQQLQSSREGYLMARSSKRRCQIKGPRERPKKNGNAGQKVRAAKSLIANGGVSSRGGTWLQLVYRPTNNCTGKTNPCICRDLLHR